MMIGSTVLTEAVPTIGVVTPAGAVPGVLAPQALNIMASTIVSRPVKRVMGYLPRCVGF